MDGATMMKLVPLSECVGASLTCPAPSTGDGQEKAV